MRRDEDLGCLPPYLTATSARWGDTPSQMQKGWRGENCGPYATQTIRTFNRTFRSIVPEDPAYVVPLGTNLEPVRSCKITWKIPLKPVTGCEAEMQGLLLFWLAE